MSALNTDSTRWETLVDLLEYRAESQPDSVVFEFLTDVDGTSQHITYGELARHARSIATSLRQKKLSIGDRAVIIYPPGLELISAYFGCLYAGIIAVPVYPPLNSKLVQKLQHIILDAKPSIILSTQNIIKKIRWLKWLKKLKIFLC